MIEKDGIIYESEEEFQFSHKVHRAKLKKRRIFRRNIGLFSLFLLPIILLLLILYVGKDDFVKEHYHIFTKARIEKMEELFSMDFENIKLIDYKIVQYPGDDVSYVLEFNGINDYKSFMINNFYGTIADKFLNENRYYDYEARYYCKNENISFTITFYKDGDYYRAETS